MVVRVQKPSTAPIQECPALVCIVHRLRKIFSLDDGEESCHRPLAIKGELGSGDRRANWLDMHARCERTCKGLPVRR